MNEFLAGILQGINSVIGNHGWSIVVFTFLIRLIILPFDYKSRVGMRRMNKVQPQIAALQKKYEKDKDKLNLKMSELYKKEKINPLSSCLPMLITLPILWAMFAAMRMVANEQVVQQVMAMLQGQEPVMEGWLWIKNIWMPDSPFVSMLPNLSTLQQVTGDIWQKCVTGETLSWLIETFQLPADPFSNANLSATVATLNAALQETSFYANSGVLPGWTFNVLITTFSIMKDWNGLFLLPLLASGTQFLMTKLQPTQPTADPQAKQQGSMSFMNWFFPLFSLWVCASYNGAFALYWVAANVIAVVENIGINKYLDYKEKKQEQADAALGGDTVK